MKFLIIFLFLTSLFFLSASLALAENTPTPTPLPQVQFVNQFTVQNEPSVIVGLLKTFISGFDSFLGGFIFYTPDPLANPIVLKDNSQIPGMTKYRDMFYQIALPLVAIITAAFAIGRLGSENLYSIKSFFFRLLIVVTLFITTPYVLSYSVQFNNLLVSKISQAQTMTSFLDDYFDQTSAQINNTNSDQYGIPSFDLSLASGILNSLGKFIVQILLFAITFLFLLGGLIYIGFQFVIRFAAILFLGVLYPVVIPFALSEKTEQIVLTFFRSWFTFLISQPAFVLGFAIATDIFDSLLKAKGPSVGLLFFYTGFLFFLGGVNVLVGRIFGDSFGSFTNNMQALIATRATTSTITSAPTVLRGLISKGSGLVNAYKANSGNGVQNSKGRGNGGDPNQMGRVAKQGYSYYPRNWSQGEGIKSAFLPGSFSSDLSKQGYRVSMENKNQGIVSVSGTGYNYRNPKTGLTAIYTTRGDAVQDGALQKDIHTIQLNNEQFIDPSLFGNDRVNPHNRVIDQEAKKVNKNPSVSYLSTTNSPERVRNFLELTRERNKSLGVSGVIIKRYGSMGGKDRIIRLYTDKKL